MENAQTPNDNLFGLKTVKTVQVDKSLNMKVVENRHNEIFFVEFSDVTGGMLVQKSFQDTVAGREDMAKFEGSFKSYNDFAKYLGLKRSRTVYVAK